MGLKDFLKQESARRLEKEHVELASLEKADADAVAVPPHPLLGSERSLVEDYVLGQLLLRLEAPPQDAEGERLCIFGRSLGLAQEDMDRLCEVASLYDGQARMEHFGKLSQILRRPEDVDCFLCDVVFLHGRDSRFEGEFLALWKSVCLGIFKLEGARASGLEKLCRKLSGGNCLPPGGGFDGVSEVAVGHCRGLCTLGMPSDTYLVVDLSGGPAADAYPWRSSRSAPDLGGDTCRTTELWLRRIPAGTFMMGSPSNELGRWDNENQHAVTLSRDYYIGVFPVTQRQWELVTGGNPSRFKESGPCAPVEFVSYDDICGPGRRWPEDGSVSPGSFLGLLRRKTGLKGFDLPTEAQWEYACRAGTTTALNNGKDLRRSEGSSRNLDEVGWYRENSGGRTHPVGEKRPNAWGLYDMHGNIWKWCRDWHGVYAPGSETDPSGPVSGSFRVLRCGGWSNNARSCRAARRNKYSPGNRNSALGFSLSFQPDQE